MVLVLTNVMIIDEDKPRVPNSGGGGGGVQVEW